MPEPTSPNIVDDPGEAASIDEPESTIAVESSPLFTTREEEHLSFQLQRLLFCFDRFAAREADMARAAIEGDTGDVDEAGPSPAAQISEQIAALDQWLADRYSDETLPLPLLRTRFGLDDGSLLLLLGAAAPGIDRGAARRIGELNGQSQPSAGFLMVALASTLAEERQMLAALRPTSPLLRWRLVRVGVNKAWSPEAPALHRPLAVPDRVVDWLRGQSSFDADRYERAATLHPGDAAPTAESSTSSPTPIDTTSPELRDRVARGLFRTDGDRRMPVGLSGPALVGKATAVRAAAASRGLPVLEVDLEVLEGTAQPVELLLDLAREAMLQGAVLLLRRLDTIDEKRNDLRRAIKMLLSDGALWVAVTTQGAWRDPLRRIAGVQLLELELPDKQEQLALWRQALPADVPLAPDLSLSDVVGRYRLTPGDILEAGNAAARSAESRSSPVVTYDDLIQAVRDRLRHRLGDVAELITTTLGWDDIVLPENVLAMILELLSSIRYQSRVMGEWGFGRKITYGRAVSALFSGPPGTGKTMVATLIAKELGLELFRVDLSRVVSKWVGETEKNLGKAFDEAKNSQAVLLFDEADALFAKRTDVKSSNDRYANLEVNYLLQRLESFEGIVLLTTNLSSSIDDAFRRRLRFRIEFPTPEQPEREMLWQAMLPAEAPVARDVNFYELGRRYEMSGGYIKNAVVRAAYLAAASENPIITHELLIKAAQLEWEAMGRLAKT